MFVDIYIYRCYSTNYYRVGFSRMCSSLAFWGVVVPPCVHRLLLLPKCDNFPVALVTFGCFIINSIYSIISFKILNSINGIDRTNSVKSINRINQY